MIKNDYVYMKILYLMGVRVQSSKQNAHRFLKYYNEQ